MRRLIASIVATHLMIVFCATPAHADEWADLDDGDIQFGVESDPSGPTSDGSGDDGGPDGGTDNVNDGGSNGGADFLCIGANGEVWEPSESDAVCDGMAQDDQDQGEPPPPPVSPADLGGQVLDTMLIPSPQVSISPYLRGPVMGEPVLPGVAAINHGVSGFRQRLSISLFE